MLLTVIIFLQKFFQPAINNIRNNLGKDSVGEEHIKEVCRQMLEEAKLMYKVSLSSRDSSPYEYSHSEADSEASFNELRLERMVSNLEFGHSDIRVTMKQNFRRNISICF